MGEHKTTCTTCGRQILQTTADRNNGLCAICMQKTDVPDRTEILPDTPMPRDLPHALHFQVSVPDWPDADSVDWQRVEEILVLLVTEYVRDFATHHSEERFYGLAFDCNADYCEVFICLNTEEDLSRQATACKKRSPDLYGTMTDQQLEDHLRWALGDWKYQAWTTDGFNDAWEPIETALMSAMQDEEDVDVEEQFADSFMQMACRAMVRLESSGSFDALQCTKDFATFVADHDELDEDSWKRLEAVRRGQSES